MLYAEKGNKVAEIDESQIDAYVAQGYKVIGANGKIIQDTIPTDVATLKLAYRKHEETIKSLKATNAELTSQIATLTAQLKSAESQLTATADTASKRTSNKKSLIKE